MQFVGGCGLVLFESDKKERNPRHAWLRCLFIIYFPLGR